MDGTPAMNPEADLDFRRWLSATLAFLQAVPASARCILPATPFHPAHRVVRFDLGSLESSCKAMHEFVC